MKKPDKSESSIMFDKVLKLIKDGEDIREVEYHAESDVMSSYVDGPRYQEWMESVNIFNERYLRKYDHPSWTGIHTLYHQKNAYPLAIDTMLSKLRAVLHDREFFADVLKGEVLNTQYLQYMLGNTIKRVEERNEVT